MLLPIAAIAVLVLAAVALAPKKPTTQDEPTPQPSPVQPFVMPTESTAPAMTIRQQQLAEESAAIAGIYEDKANEAWRAELQAKAATMLGTKKGS